MAFEDRTLTCKAVSYTHLNNTADFGIAQLGFSLAFKLRLLYLNADNRGNALADILAGKVGVTLFEDIEAAGIIVDNPG